jgi:uncharacterized protein
MKKQIILLLLFVLICSLQALDVPKLQGRINDYATILSSPQIAELEKLLSDAEASTSSQIVVLIIPSLEDDALEDFSIRVLENWKIGQAKLDNGAMLLVSINDRKLRIEVGYGLEGMLTDLKSDYIIRNTIVPEFKQNNYFQGIYAGLQSMIGIINKEFDISPEQLAEFKKQKQEKNKSSHFPFALIIFIIIILSNIGKKGGRGGGGFFWGGIGGFGGGGSSSGGFGGFSGGGGSFGGGGSSGSW